MRHFKSDGAAYQAILAYGQIRLPPRINRAREDTWNQMDMKKLRIPLYMCAQKFHPIIYLRLYDPEH